jgi:hypothetical protein
MSQQHGRRKTPIEVKDDDGAKFHYFSLGKMKTMTTPKFQRLTVFGSDGYRNVLNHMFDFVGPLNELAARVYDRKDRSGKPMPPFPDDVAQLRSMLSNLMSLGIVKYVATDGEFGSGLYYSLTEDGVELYMDFLVEKAPGTYKEVIRKFVEMDADKDKYYMPFLFLLMQFGEMSSVDPLLVSTFSNDKKPVNVGEVIKSYLDYELRVNGQEREVIESDEYKQRVTIRLRNFISNRLVEMRKVNDVDYVMLTSDGNRIIAPAMKKMSQFMNDIRKFTIVKVNSDDRGVPVGFWLTNLGASLRREYNKKIETELVTERAWNDIVRPPMPIDEIEETPPPTYTLELTTGKIYTFSKRVWDKMHDVKLIPFFGFIFSCCLFFGIVGVILSNISLIIGSLIVGGASFLILILIMAVQEIRIKIKQ